VLRWSTANVGGNFHVRLESAARVAAQEAPKYSPRTGAERKTSQEGAFTEYRAPGDLESFAQLREHLEAHPPAAES
jgi:hypothetical protein